VSGPKRLLLIDGTNIFLRSYTVNPTLTRNGEAAGGVFGTLQSLQKLVRESTPDTIIWTWDGAGGSKRRQAADKGYKAGRKPVRRHNWQSSMSHTEENDNKVWQMSRFSEYLGELPILQMIFDSVEADDIIAYCAQHSKFKEHFKIVISSDKDFIQLLNNKTVLHRPTQKETLTVRKIVEKYEIHPNNFLLARAVCGDDSDNLDGVEGVGMKTVAKRFPFLKEEKSYAISEVLDYCRDQKDKKIKVYSSVLTEEVKVRHNHSMMQLAVPQFSCQDKETINKMLEEKPRFARSALLIKMMQDGMPDWNFDALYQHCNRITIS
jgi:DNA polymerase-1